MTHKINTGSLTRREFMDEVENHIKGKCSWVIDVKARTITLHVTAPILNQLLTVKTPLIYSSANAAYMLDILKKELMSYIITENKQRIIHLYRPNVQVKMR